jgi:hypothetical protein
METWMATSTDGFRLFTCQRSKLTKARTPKVRAFLRRIGSHDVEGGWLYALPSGHGTVTKFARAEFGIPGTPEPVSDGGTV